jgi:hypothetical protein
MSEDMGGPYFWIRLVPKAVRDQQGKACRHRQVIAGFQTEWNQADIRDIGKEKIREYEASENEQRI